MLQKEDLKNSDRGWEWDPVGSDVLLVSFGSLAGHFEFFASTQGLGVDRLFLRDRHKSWYLKGIGKDYPDLDGLESFLRTKCRGYRKLVFIGNSMGGWCAILMACRIPGVEVLAFSPQGSIDPHWRDRIGDTRWSDSNIPKLGAKWSPVWDLNRSLSECRRSRIRIWYSSEDPLDLEHTRLIDRWSCVKSVDTLGGHYVVRELQKSGELARIFRSTCSN